MKKKTPNPALFLQDFCKNAQWRAKKLRERGSSTARPTEKGVGGLPIGSRFSRDLRTSSWRFVPIQSRFADFILAFRPDSVDSVAIRSRFVPIRSSRSSRVASKSRRKHKKKPDSSIVESGLSYRKASRAFNLLSVPLSNTRASARGVLRGLARRSCIVMLTSGRRRIGRYI